jgi:hypothetical protein
VTGQASGLDTASIAFRPITNTFWDQLLSKPFRRSAAGGIAMLQPGPGGTKLLAWPAYNVVAWEGRLGALLTGSETDWSLRPKTDLQVAEAVAREAIEALSGVRVAPDDRYCSDGELRRYDLAYELRFDDGRDGLAFLRTVAGMQAAGRKINVHFSQDGQPETVYWRTPKRGVVTERIYDKGLESGSDGRGQRIRIEAQRRPQKSRRMRPGVVARLDLAADFGRTMEPYLGAEQVIAAGSDGAVFHLAQRAARGEISWARAERMIGSVALLREFGRSVYPDDRQARRRLQALRSASVALDAEMPADRVVPVGQLLRQAVESFSA